MIPNWLSHDPQTLSDAIFSWLNWDILQALPASSSIKNLGFLFAAYFIVWLLIVGYLFSLSRRQKKLAQELETLKQMRNEKP